MYAAVHTYEDTFPLEPLEYTEQQQNNNNITHVGVSTY